MRGSAESLALGSAQWSSLGPGSRSPGLLDIANFERYQVKFRLGYDF
jgi:hypothetical protein